MSDDKKKPKTWQEIMDKALVDHKKIMQYQDQLNRDPYLYYPEEDMVYHTPLHKVTRIQDPARRYAAIAMGDPAQVPEDIELYIELELERIAREALS